MPRTNSRQKTRLSFFRQEVTQFPLRTLRSKLLGSRSSDTPDVSAAVQSDLDDSTAQPVVASASSSSSYNPPIPGTIGDILFSSSMNIVESTYQTGFIQGMLLGNLSPDVYGPQNVQDALYCYNGYHDYTRADVLIQRKISHATDPDQIAYLTDLQTFFAAKSASYNNYSAYLCYSWNLRNPDGIQSGPAVQEYISWEKYVVEHFDNPIYVLIAMLPCERLWAYLGNRLNQDPMKNPNNLYQFWIDENCDSSGAQKMEEFLEVHKDKIDLTVAQNVYQLSMQCENNFFASATGDYPKYPSETPPPAPAPSSSASAASSST